MKSWKMLMIIFTLAGLTACEGPTRSARYYGTGGYYCYHQNLYTGRVVKAHADEKSEALHRAMVLCDAQTPNVKDEHECIHVDCVFH